jgi:putative flavoprotein involved in K+ transport
MNDPVIDAVIVGAGHSGLAISHLLKKNGRNHVVLERGKIGESWLSQRWDTFKLNTANKLNLLPDEDLNELDPDGFCSAKKFVELLRSYAQTFDLPVSENCRVVSVERNQSTGLFSVHFEKNGIPEVLLCKAVIIASGGQNEKKIPSCAAAISTDVVQLHAAEYRNASQLPEGSVLVVGSAQSGVQVAEDMVEAGRKVFLCTSKVGRIPRRYRGKDMVDWLDETGFYNVRTEQAEPQVIQMKVPQVSGVGKQGHTVSLQSLAQRGAVILGKIERAEDNLIYLQPNAAEHVRFGDEFSEKVKSMIDGYIEKSGQHAPPPEFDAADVSDRSAACASTLSTLDLKQNHITSLIWTTGFGSDLSYLNLPVLNVDGSLKHRQGISAVDGLFFLGFPWLRSRKSGIIYGAKEDAAFISAKVEEFLKQ